MDSQIVVLALACIRFWNRFSALQFLATFSKIYGLELLISTELDVAVVAVCVDWSVGTVNICQFRFEGSGGGLTGDGTAPGCRI